MCAGGKASTKITTPAGAVSGRGRVSTMEAGNFNWFGWYSSERMDNGATAHYVESRSLQFRQLSR